MASQTVTTPLDVVRNRVMRGRKPAAAGSGAGAVGGGGPAAAEEEEYYEDNAVAVLAVSLAAIIYISILCAI